MAAEDEAMVEGKLEATVSDPIASPNATMKVTAGVGAGNKTVIGMKAYFKDGTVYPDGTGPLYKDHYAIHHITFKTGYTEPEANLEPNIQTIIKAAPRDNEAFDVSDGIPSSKPLYVQVVSDGYLYNLGINTVTETIYVGIPTPLGAIVVPFTYTYHEITNLEVYGIKEAIIENGALPDGKVTLRPSAS